MRTDVRKVNSIILILHFVNENARPIESVFKGLEKAFKANYIQSLGVDFYKYQLNNFFYLNLLIENVKFSIWNIKFERHKENLYLDNALKSKRKFTIFYVENLDDDFLKFFFKYAIRRFANGGYNLFLNIICDEISTTLPSADLLRKIGIVYLRKEREDFDFLFENMVRAFLDSFFNHSGEAFKPYLKLSKIVLDLFKEKGKLENVAKSIVESSNDLISLLSTIIYLYDRSLTMEIIKYIVKHKLDDVMNELNSRDLLSTTRAHVILTLSLWNAHIFEDYLFDIISSGDEIYSCEAIERLILTDVSYLYDIMEMAKNSKKILLCLKNILATYPREFLERKVDKEVIKFLNLESDF
ncbi:MAG: hypothetical protein ACP6IP_09755 [Candidatus Njordarchaeia archaeon]